MLLPVTTVANVYTMSYNPLSDVWCIYVLMCGAQVFDLVNLGQAAAKYPAVRLG